MDRLEGTSKDFELIKAARKARNAAELLVNQLPEFKLRDIISSQIVWALQRISYPHLDPSFTPKYIEQTRELLDASDPNGGILARIEERIRESIKPGVDHEPGVWLRELACERDALILSSSLTESIREQVERCPALRIYDTALSKRPPACRTGEEGGARTARPLAVRAREGLRAAGTARVLQVTREGGR